MVSHRKCISIMLVRKSAPETDGVRGDIFAFARTGSTDGVGRDRGMSSTVPLLRSLTVPIVLTFNACSTTLSDLVVSLGTGQTKTGAPCRSECVAKVLFALHVCRSRSFSTS